jgi:hypothetical protein
MPMPPTPAGAPVPATTAEVLALARASSPDPYPDDVPVPDDVVWHHRDGDLTRGMLRHLVADAFAANRHVDYPDTAARPAAAVTFRFRAAGDGVLVLSTSGPATAAGTALAATPRAVVRDEVLDVTVEAPAHGAAAVGVHDGSAAGTWTCRVGPAGAWAPTEQRRGGTVPADAAGEGVLPVPLTAMAPGLYALPAPGLGRVVVHAAAEPAVVTGETIAEATADAALGESRFDVAARAPGRWASRHRLGFRYVSVRGVVPDAVHAELSVRATPRRGAFVCADDRLTRIWAAGALTLRSCLQGLLIDGVKRDRMPWAGDLAVNLAPLAYAFGDAAIARDSLRALGDPRTPHVNGIADYSLWWVVAHDLHHRHFGDARFLAAQADAVHALLRRLAAETGARGLLRPVPGAEPFAGAGAGSGGAVFLDWGVRLEEGRDPVALQVLWCWALAAGGRLLARTGHPGAAGWTDLAGRVRAALRPAEAADGTWRTYVDGRSAPDPYATMLAAHAGLPGGDLTDAAQRLVLDGRFGTPFMAALALRALSGAYRPAAVRRIADRWGAMLDDGSPTFWEELPGDGPVSTAMYGRPFGMSRCHGWASGPAAALPELVLGLRPTSAGWRTAVAAPLLGDLAWAAAVVPVPGGDLSVVATADGRVRVDVPAGHALEVAGELVVGPRRAELGTPA